MTALDLHTDAAAATVADVCDAVQDAVTTGRPLRLVGAGRWLDGGRPVPAHARPLSLRALAGVVEYTPGDLTMTVRAGTTLGAIEAATRPHGQWLALDPFGTDAGTIGATIATASCGPLAHAFGRPRDLILGIELVTGHAEVVRAGGRVVKNVAGFDLTRLMTGAWGALGVLTEVTVRLRARPGCDETLAVIPPAGADAGAFARWLAACSRATGSAAAMELVNAPLARTLDAALASEGPVLLVRLAGSPELVRFDTEALARAAPTMAVDPDIWQRLRACEPPGASVVRLSGPPARVAETWADATAFALDAPTALMHGAIGRGVVRCIVPAGNAVALGAAFARLPAAVTVIAERLPGPLWHLARSPVRDRLSRGVKHAFDPHDALNPGILGDGDHG